MDNTNIKVLIVEDDPTNLVLINENLRPFGFAVDVAVDGDIATKKLAVDTYSIVLTDIIMPNLDGIQLLKHIKRHYPHINVVVISGHVEQYTPEVILNAGASEYLPKPFTPEDFNTVITRVLQKLKNRE